MKFMFPVTRALGFIPKRRGSLHSAAATAVADLMIVLLSFLRECSCKT
jgi:hypothetical protein